MIIRLGKKVTKEADLRGAECRAPARQSRPLKNPPARTWILLSVVSPSLYLSATVGGYDYAKEPECNNIIKF